MQTTKRKRIDEDKEHLVTEQNGHAGNAGSVNQNECSGSTSTELSELVVSVLSNVVVSLASFIGDTVYRRCAGTIVKSSYADHTLLLTSAYLVRSSEDENEIIDNLTIKVRLPDNKVVTGLLHHYDLRYDIAVVDIDPVHGFRAAKFGSRRQTLFESNSKVVAVGRCFDSGMFTTTNGIVTGRLKDEHFSEVLLPTCKINEVLIGGPIVGLDGYLGGMSCCGHERVAFLPRNIIIECLGPFGLLSLYPFFGHGGNKRGNCAREARTAHLSRTKKGAPMPYDERYEALCEASRCNGYPFPTLISGHDYSVFEEIRPMEVINSFEKEFDGDIWNTLSRDIDSTCLIVLSHLLHSMGMLGFLFAQAYL